jgi:hypothetical protein
MIFFASLAVGTTNITGIVQGSYLLIDKVYEEGGKFRPAIDWFESPSGGLKQPNKEQLNNIMLKSTRLFVLASSSETNQMLYVLSRPPFPKIGGRISTMERVVFMPENIVELEVTEINEPEYNKLLTNLFVYRIISVSGIEYLELYKAEENPAFYRNSIGFYTLKDVRSFTMTEPRDASKNWYRLYDQYKTKIIIKDD